MDKQSLRECIFEGLQAADNVPMTKEMDIDNGFVASFLAGWILASIRYETVDLELDKKGK